MTYPQAKQGADLLSTRGYYVVMPDFFRGQPLESSGLPMKGSINGVLANASDEMYGQRAHLRCFSDYMALVLNLDFCIPTQESTHGKMVQHGWEHV